jgi:serine/threonine-protein kinase HipA
LKYESEGGPGLSKLFALLQQSRSPEADMRTLMASQILFWLLRAPDGHAKNFSISLLPGGAFQLTPMYDVMSAYPIIGHGPNLWAPQAVKAAMALLGKNRQYHMDKIQRRHFNSTAQNVGLGADAEAIIQDLLQRTPEVIQMVQRELPVGFSQEVVDKVLGGLERAALRLEGMPVS